jgi:hypothetical protein
LGWPASAGYINGDRCDKDLFSARDVLVVWERGAAALFYLSYYC